MTPLLDHQCSKEVSQEIQILLMPESIVIRFFVCGEGLGKQAIECIRMLAR